MYMLVTYYEVDAIRGPLLDDISHWNDLDNLRAYLEYDGDIPHGEMIRESKDTLFMVKEVYTQD